MQKTKLLLPKKRIFNYMKFRVICNLIKPWAAEVAKEVEGLLKGNGKEIVQEKEDICVIVGGDGTIFYNKGKIHGAIFAIGSERSKVCQANLRNWGHALEKVLKAAEVEERSALSVKINEKEAGWAINDAVVHARRHNFVEISVKIMSATHNFGGDGVIVATPTGAGGYAYSAGGFVLDKSNFILEVVPICPYLRAARPQLAPVAYEIEISHKGAADLVIDGQQVIELGEKDVVKVIGDRIVKFIRV